LYKVEQTSDLFVIGAMSLSWLCSTSNYKRHSKHMKCSTSSLYN